MIIELRYLDNLFPYIGGAFVGCVKIGLVVTGTGTVWEVLLRSPQRERYSLNRHPIISAGMRVYCRIIKGPVSHG